VSCAAIHGDCTQNQRERALDSFRNGKVRALVATDVMARGIDVDGITHIINYDIPNNPEDYIHRIGRTARAGAAGVAVSLCTAEDAGGLRAIERLIDMNIQRGDLPGFTAESRPLPRPSAAPEGQRRQARAGARPQRAARPAEGSRSNRRRG
jgi:ATP-dependent RNA helicase RhlE